MSITEGVATFACASLPQMHLWDYGAKALLRDFRVTGRRGYPTDLQPILGVYSVKVKAWRHRLLTAMCSKVHGLFSCNN